MNDLISRAAVLEILDEIEVEVEDGDGFRYDYWRKRVKTMASAEPQRKNGRWLHPYRSDIACECSVCGMQMPITDAFNFCPNCGAKMDEVEE